MSSAREEEMRRLLDQGGNVGNGPVEVEYSGVEPTRAEEAQRRELMRALFAGTPADREATAGLWQEMPPGVGDHEVMDFGGQMYPEDMTPELAAGGMNGPSMDWPRGPEDTDPQMLSLGTPSIGGGGGEMDFAGADMPPMDIPAGGGEGEMDFAGVGAPDMTDDMKMQPASAPQDDHRRRMMDYIQRVSPKLPQGF